MNLYWLWLKRYWRDLAIVILSILFAGQLAWDYYHHDEDAIMGDVINQVATMLQLADNQQNDERELNATST